MESLLLLFVKHPKPGNVKTRLGARIGHEKAVKVYGQLLQYTAEVVSGVAADKVVYYGNELPSTDLWKKAGYLRKLQEGETLGSRMAQAFAWGFAQGYKKIAIIGSDCATLTAEILQQAFQVLDSHQGVIGPAEDGGYYLLGMRSLLPGLFRDKAWSTDTVFSATLRDFERANWTYQLLPTLSDIDTLEDIPGTFLEGFLDQLA